ncbi:MAG TPA: SIS domain-containing protein, partial [Candidatus Poseidoniia archaeon]|nr:SIS domain-containing protein [Candidatus Poseidoniia archaeon]
LNEKDTEAQEQASTMVRRAQGDGNKLILVGNGGSAAMASHVAVDLTKAAGIRAINFNEADLLTCFANDYGYEHWVAKALEFYADPGDLAVLISSSGASQNIVNGAEQARTMGLTVISLSGFSPENPLRQLGDLNLFAASDSYNIVEMTHHVWLLAIVDYLIETNV